MNSDESVEKTHQKRFAVVLAAAIALALITKAVLPEPAGVGLTPGWFTIVVDSIATMILVIGYGLGIERLLKRGGYGV